MATMTQDARLAPHRQFRPGERVASACGYRRGEAGTVVERLDDSRIGTARYGVRLDSGGVADFCRYELKPL